MLATVANDVSRVNPCLGRPGCKTSDVDVHLVDGTYELFRQYFGQP